MPLTSESMLVPSQVSWAQGRLGNCYFLAALSSCANGDSDVLIKDLIIEDGIPQARGRAGFAIANRGRKQWTWM
jgi:hypothetical protein